MRWSLLAIAFLFSNACVAQQTADIDFSGVGKVRVKAIVVKGRLPFVQLTQRRRLLLSVSIGADDRRYWTATTVDDPGLTGLPRLYLAAAPGPVAAGTWLIPIAFHVGGTDCSYRAAIIAARDGRLLNILPNQVSVNAEGGFYAGDLGDGLGYGFAAWNLIWGKEAHVDPHRYEIQLFRQDPGTGMLTRFREIKTTDFFASGNDALAASGLKVKNLLVADSRFEC